MKTLKKHCFPTMLELPEMMFKAIDGEVGSYYLASDVKLIFDNIIKLQKLYNKNQITTIQLIIEGALKELKDG